MTRVRLAWALAIRTGVAAIAVLRHRLYDIDVIINRTVLFAMATAFVAVGYVTLVVLVGGNARGFWPSLLGTALVALAFQPLRSRAVRFADRLAYGPRAVPYEALADFSRRLGDSPDPTSLLPAVAADTVARVAEASQSLETPIAVDVAMPSGRLELHVAGRNRGVLALAHIRDRVEAAGGAVRHEKQTDSTVLDVLLPGTQLEPARAGGRPAEVMS